MRIVAREGAKGRIKVTAIIALSVGLAAFMFYTGVISHGQKKKLVKKINYVTNEAQQQVDFMANQLVKVRGNLEKTTQENRLLAGETANLQRKLDRSEQVEFELERTQQELDQSRERIKELLAQQDY